MDELDALYDAAIAGDADAIAELEERANRLDERKYTILHAESENGNTERVRFILRKFANKNLLTKLTKYKHTALHLAIYEGHTGVAEVIIEAARQHLTKTSFQAFLRQGDKDNDTALHAAVMERNIDIVKLLVEADPTDPHTQNDEGKTPMFIAVEQRLNNIVDIISTTCTAPSLDGPYGTTVVRINNLDQENDIFESNISSQRQRTQADGRLQFSNIENDIFESNVSSQRQRTEADGTLYKIIHSDAFFDAAIGGDADAIAWLEKKTNILNKYGETILHIKSESGNTEHVRFILREFRNKNLLAKLNRFKQTALHLAVCKGHTEVAEVIVAAAKRQLQETSFQAFLRQRDEDGDTALHAAVVYGYVAIVKLLVEADPTDRHSQNDDGKTPMFIAVEQGLNDIVEIISTTCSAPSLDGPDGSIVVRINNTLGQVKSPGGTHYKIMDRDALFDAAIARDADAIAKLEMEANKLDRYDRTILHTESMNGNTEHVRFILREFADKNLLVKLGNQQENALAWAAYFGHTEVVELLIEAARQLPPPAIDDPITSFQAYLRHADQDSETALHAAVKEGCVDAVKLLVEADPTDTHIKNKEGKTPMYMAVEKGYNKIVEIISTICTAPSLDGPDGSTALHAAVKNGNDRIEVVKVLIHLARRLLSSDSDSHDTESNPVSSFEAFLRRVDKDLNSALHIALMQRNLATAELLVESDPSYEGTPNKKGRTPFYIAVESGYADIAKMIGKTCTTPHFLYGPSGNMTALHAVIKKLDEGNNEVEDVIKLIIDQIKKHNISSLDEIFYETDEDGNTILEVAVELKKEAVVNLILDIQHPVSKKKDGAFISLMPIIYKAEEKDYKNIVELLTERYNDGSKLSKDYEDQVGLISAIKSGKTETVTSLLSGRRAQRLVTFVDNLRWTALHHAVYHEFSPIIKLIAEAQKGSKPKSGYQDKAPTPFHIAAERGSTSILILLMQLWPSSSSTYTIVDKKGQNILHLAALQNKRDMIEGILKNCPEEHKKEFVNKQNNDGNTTLHLLIQSGCWVPELLRYEGLDTSLKNKEKWTPSDMLYVEEEIINDQVKVKVALDHIQIDRKREIFSKSVLKASERESKNVKISREEKQMRDEKLRQMKEDTRAVAKCYADAICGDPISRAALEMEAETLNEAGETILHVESMKGVIENVQFIVSALANKNLLVKLDNQKRTALYVAAHQRHTQVVKALLDAARRNLPSSSANDDTHNPVTPFQAYIRQANVPEQNTALHVAVLNGDVAIVKLLVEADPNDSHVKNNKGKTPIYIAAENGFKDVVKEICKTCTALFLDGPAGSTNALHALMQSLKQGKEEDRDLIITTINAAKRWSLEDALHANFEALFDRTDESGRTLLELAIYHNNVNAVELILREDPAYHDGHGSKNHGLLRLINQAMNNKCSKDIVQLLSQTFEAGINPDLKGVLALIIAIQVRDAETTSKLLKGENKDFLGFVDSKGWTLLHHAAYHEFDSILGIMIEAKEKVGHQFVYEDGVATPFHVAAKCGYTSTVIRLMQVLRASPSWYTTVDENDQNILHMAAVQNKKEMANGILRYCPTTHKDQLLSQKDTEGNTPLHLLVSHGCFIEDLIKYIAGNTTTNNENWTPRDMLYFQHDIVGEQVRIKMELDEFNTDQSRKLWSSTRKKNTFSSSVLPSRREKKDIIFNEDEKLLMDAKNAKMKEDLEIYKQGTNSQIVVSALITTITFTVGFTMPGGLHQSGEINEGLALLSKNAAFKLFMISDALALLLSICSLFIYFLENMSQDLDQVTRLHATTVGLNIASVMLTMFVFMTGTYVVLSQSLALTITICVISSLFFVFVIVQLLRVVYDRHRERKNEGYKKEA